MSFEAFAIKPPDTTVDESELSRTAQVVADDIAKVYNEVADRGGSVVAEHSLVKGGDRAYGVADSHWLFLDAEIPE